MPETVAFGGRLRRLREAAGLSVGELAQRVGLTRQYLYDLESGRKAAPSLDVARRLAESLGKKLRVWE